MTKPKVCLWHEMVSFSRKWLSSLIVFYDYYDDRPTDYKLCKPKAYRKYYYYYYGYRTPPRKAKVQNTITEYSDV